MKEFVADQVEQELVKLIGDACPNAVFVSKYGGKLIEAIGGNPASQFGGYFIYSNHISLEFRNGTGLIDVHGALEGQGKRRRHIKICSIDDLRGKSVHEMIIQASKTIK